MASAPEKESKNAVPLGDERPAGMFKRLSFVVPVGLAVIAVIGAIAMRGEPERAQPEERIENVRAVPATRMNVHPSITAYGTVQPARSWRAVAQVSGRVIEKHPNLEVGAELPAGTLLLKIDPRDYEIAAARARADMQAAKAEKLELDAREKSITASHRIETRSYTLAQRDLDRKQRLRKEGTISTAAIEQAERALLQAEQALRQIEAQYDSLPAQRKAVEARMGMAKAQAEKAELDMSRTSIVLPFDARIAAVNTELDEIIRAGEPLLMADSYDRFEITARLSVAQLDALFSGASDNGLDGFDVRVSLGDTPPCRIGRAERLTEGLDAQSRMAGLVISLPATDPCAPMPVQKNAYATVEIASGARAQELVVPRGALIRTEAGFDIYVADSEDRLRRRAITVARQQSNFASVSSGLAEGDRVIISAPQPPIDGLKLKVETDAALLQRLRDAAEGPAAPEADKPLPVEDNTPATVDEEVQP